MLRRSLIFPLALSLAAACSSSKPAVRPPSCPNPAEARFEKLDQSLARIERRLEHVETEVLASSAENELTAMTIDSVEVGDKRNFLSIGVDDRPVLLCHVVEWRGFGKMLRFTRKADPVFVLEAEGHPTIEVHSAEGGTCTSDGSTRMVMLFPSRQLASGTSYRLRPRNESEAYRWVVRDDLLVTAPN